MSVLKITVASCEEYETPVGYVYILQDAPLYNLCEMLARQALTVVSVDIIPEPDDGILEAALTGAMKLHEPVVN